MASLHLIPSWLVAHQLLLQPLLCQDLCALVSAASPKPSGALWRLSIDLQDNINYDLQRVDFQCFTVGRHRYRKCSMFQDLGDKHCKPKADTADFSSSARQPDKVSMCRACTSLLVASNTPKRTTEADLHHAVNMVSSFACTHALLQPYKREVCCDHKLCTHLALPEPSRTPLERRSASSSTAALDWAHTSTRQADRCVRLPGCSEGAPPALFRNEDTTETIVEVFPVPGGPCVSNSNCHQHSAGPMRACAKDLDHFLESHQCGLCG